MRVPVGEYEVHQLEYSLPSAPQRASSLQVATQARPSCRATRQWLPRQTYVEGVRWVVRFTFQDRVPMGYEEDGLHVHSSGKPHQHSFMMPILTSMWRFFSAIDDELDNIHDF